MSDGIKKNLEVVRGELDLVWAAMRIDIERLRKPSLNPKNRKHFVPHVLTGMWMNLFYARRTLGYTTLLIVLYKAGAALWGLHEG